MGKDWQKTIQLAFVAVALTCANCQAQQPIKAASQEPKTQLEAFEKQTGTVIIKSFSTVGSVSSLGNVSVECVEFTNVSTGKRQLGIVIEVKESGKIERSNRSFIDYDEIEPLLKGVDYISKVTSQSTKLHDFEAIYKTKGDVTITTFSSSSSDKVEAAVTSGYIGAATAYISTAQLAADFRVLIIRAKSKLDSIK
jgi:hypothetical protein